MRIHPRFQILRLSDRETIEPFFRAAGYALCEYTFATQFGWQPYNRTAWAIVDGWLLIRYETDGQERFLCPIGGGPGIDVAMEGCFRILRDKGYEPVIGFVPESVASALDPARFSATPDPDNHDYIYRREDLALLPGKRYAKKRNHLSQFERSGPWSFQPYRVTERAEVEEFLVDWCLNHECCDDHHLEFEVYALRACLDNYQALDVRGWLLRAGDRIIGLTVGEMLRPDTWVVHYEKAVPDRPGAYQALCREFARQVPEGTEWIDREQDMGCEGLRKSKESYYPDHMGPSWTIRPKG
jgi:hypothetical protein